jgi:anhydro-N-acetylmuramic acid kinase
MHYLGLMSGTSADAVDAVIVEIAPPHPCRLVAAHRHPLPTEVRRAIDALCLPDANEIERLGCLHTQLGELFADAARAVLAHSGLQADKIQAIGSHGQTVRHRPTAEHPFSLQLGNPSVIAERTGITTVADFRARDLAAGGQGAPLVPAFHHGLFHSPKVHRVIVNIGGLANLTDLPRDARQPVIGFDTGPGNTLMDRWIARHQRKDYDLDGAWAASGRSCQPLLQRLLSDPYFLRPPPKSTGREYFNLAWLERALAATGTGLTPADVQATLLELTAQSIARAIRDHLSEPEEIYVCGGGARNIHLIDALRRALAGLPLATTEALGLDPQWVEAAAFAWLAQRTLAGLPGNLPSVTGARRAVILGAIYRA